MYYDAQAEDGGFLERDQVAPCGACVGDRIVCTANVYHPKTKLLLVSNGTTGVVASPCVVKYDNKYVDRKARKPSAARPCGGFRSNFVVSRAMTVHKAQGNEFTYTGIILIGGWAKPQIEIMYTALSRFKRKVYVFGQSRDLDDVFIRGQFIPAVDLKVVRELTARYKGLLMSAMAG